MSAKMDENDEDGPISEINVVPFIDIILVVLIIFMVTTPFIMKPSINVDLPKASSGAKTTPSQLDITMDSTGKVLLNGKVVEDSKISQYILRMVLKDPETQAVISADKDVPHGKVVNVIDIIKTSGIKKIAIAIDKK